MTPPGKRASSLAAVTVIAQRGRVPKGEAIFCIHIPAHAVMDRRSKLQVGGAHENRGRGGGNRDDEVSDKAADDGHGDSIAGIRVA